jgi:hypothetical protein
MISIVMLPASGAAPAAGLQIGADLSSVDGSPS